MRIVVAATVVLAAACTPQAESPTTVTSVPVSTTSTTVVADDVPACLSGDLPFGASGPIAAIGEDAADATVVAGVTFHLHDGCERIVLSFFNDAGAPASSLGPVGAILQVESGILHVSLPEEMRTTAVADSLLEGSVASRVYATRDVEGMLAIDVHLTPDRPVEARVFEVGSPIRLVIDLKAAGGVSRVLAEPTVARDVVLLTPAPGAALYPLRIAGYARPDVDSLLVELNEGETLLMGRSYVMVADRDAWKAFDIRLTDGPSGAVDLFVGPVDALDEPAGVVVPLELP